MAEVHPIQGIKEDYKEIIDKIVQKESAVGNTLRRSLSLIYSN